MKLPIFKACLDSPRFDRAHVMRETGASRGDMQNWTGRAPHYVIPAKEPEGTGTRAVFSTANMVKIATMKHGGKMGLTVDYMHNFADAVVRSLRLRQDNDSMFNWREKIAVDPNNLKAPEGDPHFWEFGVLFSDYSVLQNTEEWDLRKKLRGLPDQRQEGYRDGDEEMALLELTNQEDLTDDEFMRAALDGVPARSGWLVFPIGYIVNRIVVRAEEGAA